MQTLNCRNDSNNLFVFMFVFSRFHFILFIFTANETNTNGAFFFCFWIYLSNVCQRTHYTEIYTLHTQRGVHQSFTRLFSSLFCLNAANTCCCFFPLIFVLFLYICFSSYLIALSFCVFVDLVFLFERFSNSVFKFLQMKFRKFSA